MRAVSREGAEKPTLSYMYGTTEDERPLFSTMEQHTPLLVLGETGTGKTSLLVCILRQLYEQNTARQLQCFFLDDYQQIAYLFEQQQQTVGVSVSHHSIEKMLHLFLSVMEQPISGDNRPYALLVIDEFERLFRDREHVIEPLERILLLCQRAEIREHFGLIATTFREAEEVRSLFRTTIRFGPPRSPREENLLELRRFLVSGSQQDSRDCGIAPSIRFPFPGGQELFWKSVDREHFREHWKEPLNEEQGGT